jgi:FKBP-type peptidyl-prolyl cis-trans isomerase 2
MSKVKLGDRVRVQYLGLLAGGQSTTKAHNREVLNFTAGSAQVMPGLSFGVVGMAVGEQKRLTLTAEQAYGVVDPKLIKEVPRERFAPGMELCVGKQLQTSGAKQGRRRRVKIVEVRPEAVVIDANHPLAGESLEVELQLIAVRASDA